jgi:hypothetical protein
MTDAANADAESVSVGGAVSADADTVSADGVDAGSVSDRNDNRGRRLSVRSPRNRLHAGSKPMSFMYEGSAHP